MKVNCSICNKLLNTAKDRSPKKSDVNSYLKLLYILQGEMNDSPGGYFCSSCSNKIKISFDIIIEMQTANIIMKQVYQKEIKKEFCVFKFHSLQIQCTKCDIVLNNTKEFHRHFENHILEEMALIKNSIDTKIDISIKEEAKIECIESSNEMENQIGSTFEDSDIIEQDVTNYECEFCNKKFLCKSNIRRHMRSRHLNHDKEDANKFVICKYCTSGIPPKQVRSHMKACKASFLSNGRGILCHVCGKSVDESTLRAHMYCHRDINKGSRTCGICQKVLKNGRALRSHLISHDDTKKVMCEICGEKTNPYALWRHNKKKHQRKDKKCPHCNKAFTFNYMLQNHLKIHKFDSSLQPGKSSSERLVHECPKCDKKFSYVSMLNEHLKDEHNASAVENQAEFSCHHCNKSFDDHYSLRNHLMLIHSVSQDQISDLKSVHQSGVFNCTICESVLSSEYGLRRHMRTTHGLQNKEMPQIMRRQCEKCNKSFVSKGVLTAHIRSVHLNVNVIKCDVCSKPFKTYHAFSYHRLIHLGVKPFECEVCSKTFRQRIDVLRHLQRHVRDGEATLETAAAKNNSDSDKVRVSRLMLKNSTSFSIVK